MSFEFDKLDSREQRMVDLHLCDGNDKVEAYVIAFEENIDLSGGASKEEYARVARKANYRFRKPQVKQYYDKLFKEVVDSSIESAIWTSEIATSLNLDVAKVLYNDIMSGRYSAATMKGWETANKVLNTINGLDNNSLSVDLNQQIVFKEDLEN